ncbi:iron ABC transporter permease [Microbispora sp. H10836]|uniref:ABC transporter permease n=1 Tax=Microbispora sp. H10836 TaxID=2729106 RepID=UPI001472BFF1|nr:iron ABC transporter permease [Microbispora sp. H10836]
MSILQAPKPESVAAADTRGRQVFTPARVVVAVIGLLISVLIGYPLLRVLAGIVWVDGRLSTAAITETLALPELGVVLRDTTIVVVSAVAIALVVGSLFAWLNERTDARMGVLTDVLPIVNFLMPGIATAVGWLLLLSSQAGYVNKVLRAVLNSVFGMDLKSGPLSAHSWYAVIGVYALTLVPFVYLVVSAGLRNIDSRLEEQSRMCGAGTLTTLRRVTLPALRPSFLSASFLAVWFGFAIFSVPVVLAEPAGIQIISVRIVHMLTETYPPKTAVAIGLSLVILVSLAAIWMLQQKSIRSQRSAMLGGKGAGTGRIPLGRLRIWARLAMLAYLIFAVVLPLSALVLVSFNGFWGNIRWTELSVAPFLDVLSKPANFAAVQNSLVFALIVATVAMLLSACMAWAAVTSPGRLSQVAAAIAKVPAAVPPIVIGVGIVLAVAGPPFFLGGTALILILGFLIVAMPEASITSEAAVGQVGHELGHASALSGASPLRTFRSVYLPLMMPGLAAGWTLIFVRIMADVEMSVLLASTGTPVIGFQLLSIFEGSGGYAELAALALFVTITSITMVTIVLSTTAALQRRRSR